MPTILKKFIKNYKIIFTATVATICFTIPIILFGIKDREDYDLGLFSSKVIYENFNLFIFFYDLYGPGVKFPIGQGLFLHPFIIFLGKIKFFYFILISTHILIQTNYFSKILKQFKIYNKKLVPILLLIFSISNFNYIYSDDWSSNFTSYTFLFVSFYYLNKIITKETLLSYTQFVISISFMILNGHSGLIFIYLLFFIFYILLNRYDLIFKKLPYVFLFILIIIISEHLYWLVEDYLSYNVTYKNIQTSYTLKNFFHSLISPLLNIPQIGFKLQSMFELDFQINRLPSYGLLIFISLAYSVFLIIKKRSFETNYLNFLLIIFILFSITELSKIFYIIPAIWQLRDIINVIAIILFAKLFVEIKLNKLLKFTLKVTLLLILVIFFILNILIYTNLNLIIKNFLFETHPSLSEKLFHKSNFKNQSSNNFIVNVPENNNFLKILTKIKINDQQHNRIYLGPQFYNIIIDPSSPLRKYGIYGPTDFSRFNLINFNVPLKNSSIEYFEKSPAKMYSQNTPSLEDINNKLYLNIFKIKYLLISSKEYYEIKSKDLFLIINKFYLNDSEYFILKNQNNHLNTIVTDYQINQINKLSECQIDLRKCIKKINELNLYSYANNIEIKRQGLNKYNITNKLPKDINLVIPFTFNKNWNSKNNVERLGKYLQTIKAKSSQLVLFEYFDLTRFILKCISILSFIILSITFIKLKLKKLHL
jgi:hypothetical protein